MSPPRARRTPQLSPILTLCSLPAQPHPHGGKASRCRWHILTHSTDLPKGILTEAEKDAENMLRARKDQDVHHGAQSKAPTWAALRCPQPGQPGCRQPKPAVSDPPLVAIKHSKVHEPATKAAFSKLKAGPERWDAGSRLRCPHTRKRRDPGPGEQCSSQLQPQPTQPALLQGRC